MFLVHAQHASTGSIRFVIFDNLLTPSPQNTLVHAFVAFRVDCCNTVLAGSPRFITDGLQRVHFLHSECSEQNTNYCTLF